MSGARAAAVWTAVWVAVVAVVATSVWLVISRAGAGVSSSETRFEGAAGSSSSAPSPSPSRTPTRTPTGPSSGPSSPSADPTSTSAAPVEPTAPVRRTASGRRGTLTVECTGAAAALTGATPVSGASSEVEDPGPDRVRVDFEDDDGRTRIEASCSDGAPVFELDDD